jgi:hypothetical protein
LPAISTIVVRTTNGVKEISAEGTTFNCSLIPGRASTQRPRVVFDRDVIRRIKAALLNVPADDLIAGSGDKIEALKQGGALLIEEALKMGPEIGSELGNGVTLVTGKRDGTAAGPWCAIYVTQVSIPQEPKVSAAPQGLPPPAPEASPALATPPVGLVEPEAPVTAQTFTPTLTQQTKEGQTNKPA